ncbi:FMN-binding protein [Alcanivorax sp. JB21]|uniref:FMN-binding protein n=1 Tax=Alcanivorax limicola TaxID=2874102 RepID=UPI001CBD529C|nr:FMN-binding protein [Alcanivorax limicola]MBZ2188689.1 FMN-binding protein [Alcanivorax limicola]
MPDRLRVTGKSFFPVTLLLGSVCLLLAVAVNGYSGHIRYMSNDDFLAFAFDERTPHLQFLLLDQTLREEAEQILERRMGGARQRYWRDGERTAWIMEEIGKEYPITMGLVVGPDGIEHVRILVYREPRGGEVHERFFTRQFEGAMLTNGNRLDRPIDNITGATLSVDAVSRVARLVLRLHDEALR